jgi:hypothetical protein
VECSEQRGGAGCVCSRKAHPPSTENPEPSLVMARVWWHVCGAPSTPHKLAFICEHACRAPALPLHGSYSCSEHGENERCLKGQPHPTCGCEHAGGEINCSYAHLPTVKPYGASHRSHRWIFLWSWRAQGGRVCSSPPTPTTAAATASNFTTLRGAIPHTYPVSSPLRTPVHHHIVPRAEAGSRGLRGQWRTGRAHRPWPSAAPPPCAVPRKPTRHSVMRRNTSAAPQWETLYRPRRSCSASMLACIHTVGIVTRRKGRGGAYLTT